jgi:hypothetical protein
MNSSLQSTIDLAWDNRASLDATNSPEIRAVVEEVITQLDAGESGWPNATASASGASTSG